VESPDDVAKGGIKPCALKDMDIVYSAPEIMDISGFQRSFVPANKRTSVSDFNMLHPTIIPRGSQEVHPKYDLMPEVSGTSYQREFFPATFDDPNNTSKRMGDDANDRMEDEEVDVFIVQGQCKNPTFLAGQYFHVAHDKTKTNSSNDVGTPSSIPSFSA
jgi:hypothetical protein